MRELVAKCLVKDPTKRPTAAQVRRLALVCLLATALAAREWQQPALLGLGLRLAPRPMGLLDSRFIVFSEPAHRVCLSVSGPLQLLDNKFFKTAHDNQYLQKHLLVGLPPAPERVQLMRQGHVSLPASPAAPQPRWAGPRWLPALARLALCEQPSPSHGHISPSLCHACRPTVCTAAHTRTARIRTTGRAPGGAGQGHPGQPAGVSQGRLLLEL